MKNMTTGKAGVKPVSAKYAKWAERFPLRPITEAQYDNALQIYAELMRLSNAGKLTEDERAYYGVLDLLIADYEAKNYEPIGKSTPGQMLEFLMEQNDLKQVDLVKELGSQTAVSLILNDKRKPTREQIEALAKRFSVSPALFFGE